MNIKNKKANPKISVIITCYNYGKFIDEAIDSVRDQTFKDWELIIIDDCSTDKPTKERIKYLTTVSHTIVLKENIGVSKARNFAIKQAQGEYILCLDADDKIEPTCLQKMYDIITTGKYDIVGCGYQEFGESDKRFIGQYSKYKICTENLLPVTALFKKSDWQEAGGFKDVECEDHMFWLQLTELNKKFFIIQEALLLYRKHIGTSRHDKVHSLALDLKQGLEVQRINENPTLFHWFIQGQKEKIRTLRKKNNKHLKFFLLTIVISIGLNFLQILY